MSPRGKAKAKADNDENGGGRRVRESRNVKTKSYKDFSDSEDDKPLRKRKEESESESMSEEEKPKKKATKGRRVSARSKKVDSDSEEASDISEESSDEDNSKRRKSTRKPIRSLRAPPRASYKDLSNSEEDSGDQEDSKSASEKEDTSQASGKRKRGRPPKGEKKEDSSDGEEKSEPEDIESKNSAPELTSADSTSEVKRNDESVDKEESNSKASKKSRPEHEMSEEELEEEIDDEDEEQKKGEKTEGGAVKKRGRPAKKKDDSEDEDAPAAKKSKVGDKPVLNKTDTDYGSVDFSSDAKTKAGEPWNFKISSWNVAGLKAIIKKNGLDFIKHENPDILCLQETKCSEKKLPPEAKVDGYHAHWLSGEKEGYAGVAILSKIKPLNVTYGIEKPEIDNEGRVITAEYDKFFVVNVYVPNAGQGLKTLSKRLDWDPSFRAYLKKLDEQKPVILCGDMNVAHSEIDLANPKTNVKNAGFTPQEREGMTNLLKEGFIDTFRNLYPEKTGAYSFWSYFSNSRARNIGWRLDYFITSERFTPQVCDNVMRTEVYGSDHCPITLFLKV